MCGIVGIMAKDGLNERMLQHFVEMHLRCQVRGHHATGFMNENMDVFKIALPAQDAVKDDGYKQLIQQSIGQRWIIGHTRWATRGPPFIIENDHPVYLDQHDKMVVHNGIFGSPEYDKDKTKTDTFIPLWILGEDDCTGNENMLNSLVKVYDNSNGQCVYILATPTTVGFSRTNGRPLVFYTAKGNLMFASTEAIMGIKSNKEMGPNQAYSFNKETNRWKYIQFTPKVNPYLLKTKPSTTSLTGWNKARQTRLTPVPFGHQFDIQDTAGSAYIPATWFADHCKEYLPLEGIANNDAGTCLISGSTVRKEVECPECDYYPYDGHGVKPPCENDADTSVNTTATCQDGLMRYYKDYTFHCPLCKDSYYAVERFVFHLEEHYKYVKENLDNFKSRSGKSYRCPNCNRYYAKAIFLAHLKECLFG